ncbi:CD225/dispanin family protein [Flavobacteriaceae bacterium S0862]|nr:CD225/dispanin family protein [Flavobacteriaceae bacterium S0862]
MEQIKPPRPDSYLALAIISTIICCLPLGIVSIVYATKVNSLYADGNYDEAIRASKNAKTWGLVSVGVAVVGFLIYILIFGVAIFGALSNGNF